MADESTQPTGRVTAHEGAWLERGIGLWKGPGMVCVRMSPDKTVAPEGRALTSHYTVDAFKLTTCWFFGVSQEEAGMQRTPGIHTEDV